MGCELGAPIRGGVDCKPGASRAWPWTSLNWAPLSGVAVDCELGTPLGVAVDFTELGAPLGVAVDFTELGAPLGVAADCTELGAPLGRGRGLH